MKTLKLFSIDWTNDGQLEFDLLEQAFNSLLQRTPTNELLLDPNPLLRRLGEQKALIARDFRSTTVVNAIELRHNHQYLDRPEETSLIQEGPKEY